jgi:hypothetical protein
MEEIFNDKSETTAKTAVILRLGRLLPYQMELAALGKFQKRALAAGIHLASFDCLESAGLCRPSFSFSSFADSVSLVF